MKIVKSLTKRNATGRKRKKKGFGSMKPKNSKFLVDPRGLFLPTYKNLKFSTNKHVITEC